MFFLLISAFGVIFKNYIQFYSKMHETQFFHIFITKNMFLNKINTVLKPFNSKGIEYQ